MQQPEEAYLQAQWQATPAAEKCDSDWIAAWVERAKEMTQLFGSEMMVGYEACQTTLGRNLDLSEPGYPTAVEPTGNPTALSAPFSQALVGNHSRRWGRQLYGLYSDH